jgi:hypothetical protein
VHPLADFRLKLNRANGHLETLKGEIDAWFEKQPYGVTGKYEPGPPEKYVLYFRFFEPPHHEWGLLIGEFAHNARSALDYLAWQLVQANNHTPGRRTQFPITLSPWDWGGENGARRLRGASARHVTMVERFQPYNRLDTSGSSYARQAFLSPLAVLNFLSNEDKHRVLVTTAAALRSIGWDIIGTRDVSPVEDTGYPFFGPLIDGSPLLEIPVTATGRNPEVEVEFTERAQIAVDYRVEVENNVFWKTRIYLLEELDEISAEVRHIFQVFVREFV